MHKRLAILGSTGSIGTQTLGIVAAYPDLFTAAVLAAGSNAELLIEQAKLHRPGRVVIGNDAFYKVVRDSLAVRASRFLPAHRHLRRWHHLMTLTPLSQPWWALQD